MSYARSPRLVCSTTIGTRAITCNPFFPHIHLRPELCPGEGWCLHLSARAGAQGLRQSVDIKSPESSRCGSVRACARACLHRSTSCAPLPPAAAIVERSVPLPDRDRHRSPECFLCRRSFPGSEMPLLRGLPPRAGLAAIGQSPSYACPRDASLVQPELGSHARGGRLLADPRAIPERESYCGSPAPAPACLLLCARSRNVSSVQANSESVCADLRSS